MRDLIKKLKAAVDAGDNALAEKIKKEIDKKRKEQFKKEIIRAQVMGVRG